MPPHLPKLDSREETERRRPIYADVEELIIPGFLSRQVMIGDTAISLRTLYPGDLLLLRHRVGPGFGMEKVWREWAVASAIWAVDGQVVLGDVNAAFKVRQALRNLPRGAVDTLFSVYTGLFNRVSAAISRIEAFCYEDFSRALWRMSGRQSPSIESVAGVPGVSALGMNQSQRLWVAYNEAEDMRMAWQQEWAAAKLVASASNPKGVRRLNSREESERKLEDERRQGVIERIYREVTGKHLGEQGGLVVYRSVSAEELIDEMNRMARGEKDWHDTVIDAYKQKIREKQEGERRRHEDRMQAVQELQASGAPILVGYTADQLRELRGGEVNLRRGAQVVAADGHPSRVYRKFVEREIPVGGIGKDGKGIGLPVGGGLAEQVAGRRVLTRTEGES